MQWIFENKRKFSTIIYQTTLENNMKWYISEKNDKVVKLEQEKIRTVNYLETIREIKLKWYPELFTKSKFPRAFFPLYLHL